jgi:hypothetical protein
MFLARPILGLFERLARSGALPRRLLPVVSWAQQAQILEAVVVVRDDVVDVSSQSRASLATRQAVLALLDSES